MAFASATHDIAADGFYMLGLEQHAQAYFVGIRSTFYRIATIVGQGLLVMLAGNLEVVTRNIKYSWSLMFYGMAGLFIAFWLWHHYILPRPTEDKGIEKMNGRQIMQEFWHTLKTFFQKPQVWAGICFMLFCHRTDLRRYPRRYRCQSRWTETLALADGHGYHPT